jgi:hypothetical protein
VSVTEVSAVGIANGLFARSPENDDLQLRGPSLKLTLEARRRSQALAGARTFERDREPSIS